MSSIDKNIGKAWSTDEENKLIEELKTLNIEEIATLHQRTIGGIEARIRVIGCRLLQQGIKINDVCEMLKVSDTILQKSMNMRKKSNRLNNNDNETVITLLKDIRDLLNIIANK